MENFETFDFEHGDSFQFRKLFDKVLGNWYYLLGLVVIAGLMASVYLFLSTPQYQVSARLLVNNGRSPIEAELLKSPNMVSGSDVEDQVAILESKSLIKNTIRQLNFRVGYFKQGRYTHENIYAKSPFIVWFDSLVPVPVLSMITVQILPDNKLLVHHQDKNTGFYNYSNEHFIRKEGEQEFTDTVAFGEKFMLYGNNCMLDPRFDNLAAAKTGEVYGFQFNTPAYLYHKFSRISASNVSKTSIIKLVIKGDNKQQINLFLNTYLENYLQRDIKQKNKVATATIDFINSQLNAISDSLYRSEFALQNYRSENKILNIDYQAQQIYDNINALEAKKQAHTMQLRYYEYLKDYLTNASDELSEVVVPSTVGIENTTLNKNLLELAQMQKEYDDVLYNSKKTNPYIENIRSQLESMRENLALLVENNIANTMMAVDEINNTIDEATQRFKNFPREQRELMVIERQFTLNNNLYNFLLQRRSEMQITRASTIPANEILDYATLDETIQIAPNRKKIYTNAFLIAVLLPLFLFYFQLMFNDKITEQEEVEKLTKFKIVGNILHYKQSGQLVFENDAGSAVADSIRSIRTNLKFLLAQKSSNVILITSSTTNEGKSFASLNLAHACALNQKKTVLIDFDLRKAKIMEYTSELDPKSGLSTYLCGLSDIAGLVTKSDYNFLDIIQVGDIPPNPTELVEGEYTKRLFDKLKQEYDIIVVDSPPLSSISDALLLTKYSDVNLFITRLRHTSRKILKRVTSDLERSNIPVNIIINDVRSFHGYNYGYYGYGQRTKNKSVINHLKDVVLNSN